MYISFQSCKALFETPCIYTYNVMLSYSFSEFQAMASSGFRNACLRHRPASPVHFGLLYSIPHKMHPTDEVYTGAAS
jgi:hypothetical protein